MANMLRDYCCKLCGYQVELFDDEGHKICPQCGRDGLKKTISAINIRTGAKKQPTTNLADNRAGIVFQVNEGEIMGSVPIVAGEEINFQPGEKKIIALQPDPDPTKIRLLAKAMEGSGKPDNSKLH